MADTPHKSSAAIAPIQRNGRIVQLSLNTDLNGNVVATSTNSIITPSNAFYIVDSTYQLVLRTDISGTSAFPCQTGESFNQLMGHLYVSSVLNLGGLLTNYNCKIWVGTDSHVGFIDHRTQPASNFGEFLAQDPGGGLYSVPGNSANFTIAPSGGGSGLITELMVANTDSSNIVYLMGGPTGTFYIMPLFPLQVYRIPCISGPAANSGINNPTIYVKNPNASAVNVTVCVISRTTQYNLENTP